MTLLTDKQNAHLEATSDYPMLGDAIGAAVKQLDAAWEYDAARGMRDGLDGHEYQRRSPVPWLQAILDEHSSE